MRSAKDRTWVRKGLTSLSGGPCPSPATADGSPPCLPQHPPVPTPALTSIPLLIPVLHGWGLLSLLSPSPLTSDHFTCSLGCPVGPCLAASGMSGDAKASKKVFQHSCPWDDRAVERVVPGRRGIVTPLDALRSDSTSACMYPLVTRPGPLPTWGTMAWAPCWPPRGTLCPESTVPLTPVQVG